VQWNQLSKTKKSPQKAFLTNRSTVSIAFTLAGPSSLAAQHQQGLNKIITTWPILTAARFNGTDVDDSIDSQLP
jgi:hypothetical protein